MMEPWILIWFVVVHQGAATHSQEFSSRPTCEDAAKTLRDIAVNLNDDRPPVIMMTAGCQKK